MIYIAILLLLILFNVNYFLHRDFAFPSLIQSCLWFFILLLFLVFEEDFYEVTDYVYYAVILSVAGFTVGGFFSKLPLGFTRPFEGSILLTPAANFNIILKLGCGVVYCILPFFIYHVYSIAGGYFSSDFFYRAREALVEDDGRNMFGIGYYFNFSLILMLLRLISNNNSLSMRSLIFFMPLVIISVLCMQKGFFLFFTISIIGVILMKNYSRSFRIISFLCLFLLFSFLLISYARLDAGSDILSIFKVYLLAGLPALSEVVSLSNGGEWNVFRVVALWLNRFGMGIQVSPVLQDFVAIPFGTNVYTYIRPYLIDFGLFGVFVFNAIFGAISGYCFARGRAGSPRHIILYALILYPLVMQFFDDQYFQWMSAWIFMYSVLWVILKIAPLKVK